MLDFVHNTTLDFKPILMSKRVSPASGIEPPDQRRDVCNLKGKLSDSTKKT